MAQRGRELAGGARGCVTNGDKQGDREDSWPGREDGPELRSET